MLYLTSWNESNLPGELRRIWKGYQFEILNDLTERDLIRVSIRSKSVYLTEAGIIEAKVILRKYLGNVGND
nr:DUF6429 family protein [Peribacillus alkalitolerans]